MYLRAIMEDAQYMSNYLVSTTDIYLDNTRDYLDTFIQTLYDAVCINPPLPQCIPFASSPGAPG